MDMQKFTLIGRATDKPEIKTSKSGEVSWAQFNLAVNRKVGEKDIPTFFRIKIFSDSQEQAEEYIDKGCTLFIEGRPEANAYINKDGEIVKNVEVYAYTWNLVGYPLGTKKSKKAKKEEDQDDL